MHSVHRDCVLRILNNNIGAKNPVLYIGPALRRSECIKGKKNVHFRSHGVNRDAHFQIDSVGCCVISMSKIQP